MTTNHEIPNQFSDVFGMGAPVQVYKAKSLLAEIIMVLLLFGGGGGAFLYTGYILWNKWGVYYPPVIFKEILPWVIGGVVASLIGLIVVWSAYTKRKKAAVVYQSGMAYSDRKGVRSWRWDDIHDLSAAVTRHYTNGIYTGTTHIYTLFNKQREELVLTDAFKDVENLYNHIQNNTFDLRYSRVAEAYNNGQSVSFGPAVAISKTHGIKIGKKAYPWEEIEQVGINKGVLSIKKRGGGWFSGATATAASIPNLHVLLSIINQITGVKTGK